MSDVREAVALVVKRIDGKILGISRGMFKFWDVNLPGGKVEPGETPEQALIREVREETGVTVKKPVFLYRRICEGETDFNCSVFTADYHHGNLKMVGREGWVRFVFPETMFYGTFGEYNKKMFSTVDFLRIKTIFGA